MYRLVTERQIEDITYGAIHVILFRRDYDLDQRAKQFEALEWAMSHPNYDFKGISPIFSKVRFSDEEIFTYLKKLRDFMKDNNLDKE
ncbi:hypothetical protein [Chryseobacterium gregarium]|uniref:hypothetical protein n=1 Tax=Chryseobacterium gregarium TaxID=456299 RepID=UPI0003FA0D98|nr:hypothetical protein [Chryseobacterium gregarium]